MEQGKFTMSGRMSQQEFLMNVLEILTKRVQGSSSFTDLFGPNSQITLIVTTLRGRDPGDEPNTLRADMAVASNEDEGVLLGCLKEAVENWSEGKNADEEWDERRRAT